LFCQTFLGSNDRQKEKVSLLDHSFLPFFVELCRLIRHIKLNEIKLIQSKENCK
jgi:hypothetical protein